MYEELFMYVYLSLDTVVVDVAAYLCIKIFTSTTSKLLPRFGGSRNISLHIKNEFPLAPPSPPTRLRLAASNPPSIIHHNPPNPHTQPPPHPPLLG